MNLRGYDIGTFYDEMMDAEGRPRPGARLLYERMHALEDGDLLRRQQAAEIALLNMGITFSVYGSDDQEEKIFPFDIIPRIIEPGEWAPVERGLKQRITALNLFLGDIYGEQKILADGIIPREVIESCPAFRSQCVGLKPPKGIGSAS